MQRFKAMMSGVDMTEGAPWKKLLIFTTPLLIGNIFQQLYGLVDAIMLGNWVGVQALAAVTSVLPIFFLIMVFMMGVAMGAGVMVSQYFGAKKREELSRTIGVSITLTTLLGVFVAGLGPLGTRWLLAALDTPPEIIDYSVIYINVILWGVLGLGYFNIFSGILRGVGDAFSPLVYLIFASLLNIALNVLFIYILGLGVAGAAVGTVVAQSVSALLCLRRMRQMKDVFDLKWAYLVPQRDLVRQVLKLGVPTGASQAVFAISMMMVQPLVNGFGLFVLAANNIVMKIDGLVMMPNFSFGNAMTVYAGQNMGANKPERVSQGTKQCTLLALGTAFVLVVILLIFGRQIAGWFTDIEEVLDMSVRFLRILAVGYLAFSINIVLWGTIRGAGDAMTPMYAAMINTALIRVPSAFLFVRWLQRPEALIYSLLLGWVSLTVLAAIAYKIGKWRKSGLVAQENAEE
ncbi:MAG: MATE family efflux transporter [Defluviitaleaceae bacterium]|nr:MATE family efflux transporter [Defluviitaleaceae bacterium]MCL2238585.1 MATE family efflux transporter [Defluviitaleaceae bacterium]